VNASVAARTAPSLLPLPVGARRLVT